MSSLKSLSEEDIKQRTRTLAMATDLADELSVSYDEENDDENAIREKILQARRTLLEPPKVYLTGEELKGIDKSKVIELGEKYFPERMKAGGLTVGAIRKMLIERGNVSPLREGGVKPPAPLQPASQRESDEIAPKPLNCDDVFRSNDSCNSSKHTKEFIRQCAEEKGITLQKDLSKKGMCDVLVPPKKKADILSQIDMRGLDEMQKKRLKYLNQFSVPELKEIISGVRQSKKHSKCYPIKETLKDSKHELLRQMVSWEKEYTKAFPENGLPNLGAFDKMYSKAKRQIISWSSIKNDEAEPIEDEIDVHQREAEPAPAPRRIAETVARPVARPEVPHRPAISAVAAKYPEVTKDASGKSQDPSPCGKTGRNVGTFIRGFEKAKREDPNKPLSDIFEEFATSELFKYKKGQVALPPYLSNNIQGAARYLCEIHEEKKCDSDVDCEDGKSCDVDANRCVSVHPDVPSSNKRTINGRLFVGSEKALALIENKLKPARAPSPQGLVSPNTSPVRSSLQKCDSGNKYACPEKEACDLQERKCKVPPSGVSVETIDGIKVFGSAAAIAALKNERMLHRSASPEREIAPLGKPKEGNVVAQRPVIQDLNIPNHAVADVRKRILQCLKIV